jgi:hypothetical protein
MGSPPWLQRPQNSLSQKSIFGLDLGAYTARGGGAGGMAAGERPSRFNGPAVALPWPLVRFAGELRLQIVRRYWTTACPRCSRWEHEHVLDIVQQRLDANPQAMRVRRETVEHPFGTLKMRMGATHFLMKRLPKARPRWPCTCSPTTSRGS